MFDTTIDDKEEFFAKYGKLMFTAQLIERLIETLLISQSHIIGSRFDEKTFEQSKLTLGQFVSELDRNHKHLFTEDEMDMIKAVHKTRDHLVHRFWNDNSVELVRPDLNYLITDKLVKIESDFILVTNLIRLKLEKIMEEKKIDVEGIQAELIASGKTPEMESFRKLTQNETLINVQTIWMSEESKNLLFTLDDGTNWILCESGLTQFKDEITNKRLEKIEWIDEFLPVRQFNGRPKKIADGHYDLDFKKQNLKLTVRPLNIRGRLAYLIDWLPRKK